MNEPKSNKTRKREFVLTQILLGIYDVVFTNLAYAIGIWIRFDFNLAAIGANFLEDWLKFIPLYAMIVLFTFYMFRLYHSIWSAAGVNEFARIVFASIITAASYVIFNMVLGFRLPRSAYFIGAMVQTVFVGFIRFLPRIILSFKARRRRSAADFVNVMVIGAGSAGQMIIREYKSAKELSEKVVCVIDDDQVKVGRYVEGVPIVGNRHDIMANVVRYDVKKIIVAIPSASKEQRRDILSICQNTDCELQIVPGLYQLVNGELNLDSLRKVEIADLLGRDAIKVNLDEIMGYVGDRVIMVTGGGGSIGSELCRQIAAHKPKRLIIFDIYENNAYDIQQELKRKCPDLDLVTLIGSVRDAEKLDSVFATYKPDIVYHAAAHKHVPLMEDSPAEAIKNNVFGTYNTAKAAIKYGVSKFVLISTDKAVNPTNIMGASKRMCEMIIQSLNGTSDTEFVAVRFGNVLGSNGSVIPLFKKQIEEGGPVTVTHPDIIRYFMTIEEAVSLVLQAGAYAKGGEIFVLDMGSPVKIDDLARNLIRLAGYTPDVNIKIVYTGLRPGEKLYEELLMSEEGMKETNNNRIFIGKPIDFDEKQFLGSLPELREAAYRNEADMKQRVASIVSTYHMKQD
ncbi:MAG: polysaccharide biosynthesis protein [Lachnospiraceae bacterium]|nr:polysaccharide biosynthesis protein [Lachnospiraceae bacterium]